MNTGVPILSGESNIGLGRSRNEDNYCIVATPGFPSRFAMVVDGIGGHADGDVASMYCCRRIMHAFLREGRRISEIRSAAKFLVSEISAANRRLCERNEFDRRKRPMGCTAICAVFTPGWITFCGAGDSRLYEYDRQSGKLRQLSTDDVSCDGSALCRAVGIRRNLLPEPKSIPLAAGNIHLLCSDGLHHFVAENEIAAILSEAATARMAVSTLMRRALLRNAGDNITIIAAFNPKSDPGANVIPF